MSKKTSTAALESFCKRRLTNRRRAPRHPAGGRRGSKEVKKQRSNEKTREFGQAQIVVRQGGGMAERRANGLEQRTLVILPVILRITFSLVLWTLGTATMTLTEAQMEKQGVSHEVPSIEKRHEFH